MRKVQEHQFGLGQVPIGEIKLDPKSRDDIPAVLRGLQVLYEERRSELWVLLEANVCPDSDHRLGRPGMDLWRILVLGVLKQGLDCDFDRVHELANQHRTVRAMLCHGDFDAHEYQYQMVVDNVVLLTATDTGLLMDAVRCMVRDVVRACARHHIGGWRQHAHHVARAKRLARRVGTAKMRRRRPEAVGEYVAHCRMLADRTAESVRRLVQAATRRSGRADRSGRPMSTPNRETVVWSRPKCFVRRGTLSPRVAGAGPTNEYPAGVHRCGDRLRRSDTRAEYLVPGATEAGAKKSAFNAECPGPPGPAPASGARRQDRIVSQAGRKSTQFMLAAGVIGGTAL